MAYIGNNPKFQTIVLRPQSSDPSNPTEGQMQYSDGTVRPEGMWQYKDGAWQRIGSGGALNFDEFGDADAGSTSNFTTGNNATFDGGGTLQGTFAKSTTAADLINGTSVYKYTQAAGSTNDYIVRKPVPIPQGYRGRELNITFQYRNTAASGVTFVVKDQTNNTILYTETLPQTTGLNNIASAFSYNFIVPSNCQNIGYGFQVTSATNLATITWDDVVVSTSGTVIDTRLMYQAYVIRQANNDLINFNTAGNLRFNLGSASITNTGDAVIVVTDSADGTRFTAAQACLINFTSCGRTTNGTAYTIRKNGGTFILYAQPQANGVNAFPASMHLNPGDYITVNSASAWTTNVGAEATCFFTAFSTNLTLVV